MTRTNSLTQSCLQLLELHGALAWRSNQIPVFDKATGKPRRFVGRKGVPDILCIFRGVPVGVEIKTGRDKLSAFQKEFASDLHKAGGIYIEVIDNADELQKLLSSLKTQVPKFVEYAMQSDWKDK